MIVTADDTTGALESAALAADAGFDAFVAPHTLSVHAADVRSQPGSMVVVDLRSRHVEPDVAGRRLSAIVDSVRAHKIDSTLRGNWPAEVAAGPAPLCSGSMSMCTSSTSRQRGAPG